MDMRITWLFVAFNMIVVWASVISYEMILEFSLANDLGTLISSADGGIRC
jgi:hypothetical protein